MLSKKCQYALHALVYIAEHDPTKVVTIQEIATKKNIPRKFLEIILSELKQGGVILSRKGKSGGYYLERKPAEINILEVVRLIDGAVAMLPCVSLNFYESCGRCEDESTCKINKVFSAVRDQTLKILSTSTLADLSNIQTLIGPPKKTKAKVVKAEAVPGQNTLH
jgi:Rrf2 family protein